MDFNKFLIEWATADMERYGFDDFIAILAEIVPCNTCPLRHKCKREDCEAMLHKELGVE